MTPTESIETLAFALENAEALRELWRKRLELAIDMAKPSDFSTSETLGQSILLALRLGAMDIHIEHRPFTTTTWIRVDGDLRTINSIWEPDEMQSAFQSLFYNDEAKPFDLNTPRGTSIKISLNGIVVKLHMHLERAPTGFDITIQILPSIENRGRLKTQIEKDLLLLSVPAPADSKNYMRI